MPGQLDPDHLLLLFGRSVADGFSKAASDTLARATEGLVGTATALLPAALQPFLPAFASEFTRIMIFALLQGDRSTQELRNAVARIEQAPFHTGVEQLRLALDAPVVTSAQLNHRTVRLQEARNNLDTASQQSRPEYRAVVDFYRGLASFHIEGAGFEAATHWSSFARACKERAVALAEAATHEDHRAQKAGLKAEGIPYENLVGKGLGMFDRAIVQVKRAELIAKASKYGATAAALREAAAVLDEAAIQSEVLVSLAQAKE